MTALEFEKRIWKGIESSLDQQQWKAFADRIRVGVPDRKIENWLYAGITSKDADGTDGVKMLDRHLEEYVKPSGPIAIVNHPAFSLTNALASPSFRRFAERIQGLGCEAIDEALSLP